MVKSASHPTPPFEFQLERPEVVALTENQKKVISDKYLKGDPSVEVWLARVARNVAYAELLYHPSSQVWGLFDGVKVTRKDATTGAVQAGRSWLLHIGSESADDREKNFKRFIENSERAAKKFPEAKALISEWENRFYSLMASWRFLPNSPTLMNAGRDLQQLSACYVLPVEDSMEGITHALQAQALIHKSGGGTGFSFGRLRPQGDAVKTTAGVASGALSFMQVFDKMTAVVKQGGNRRGANMGILPYWHPEIKEFIRLKSRPGVMENFNLSVAVDDKFLDAAEKGLDYDLVNPRTGTPESTASARQVFDLIVENAWKSGDPGVIFLDRINSSGSNPTPELGRIEATNPCGEQPLLSNEPCNLGSLNLSLFVRGDTNDGEVLWDELRRAIFVAIRFLDDVIDVNNYPLPEIEIMAKGNRRIGLGIMGWAEALVKLGLPYDSDKALALAGKLMKYINEAALEASEELARERGVFPNWEASIYNPQGKFFRGAASYPRNCARTTIAPTGTIGLAAGLQGTGIEPFYAIAYTRYTALALEALRNNTPPEAKDVYFEVNPLFRRLAEKFNYFGLGETALWKRIEKNRKSVRGIPEIPASVQALFATAHDVSVEYHVRMQAVFQEFTDNGVSKTINLPHGATQDDVRRAFRHAHSLGCKGITVYRDGSRQQQVLNVVSKERKSVPVRDFSSGVSSEYYEIKTGHGPLHIHIDYDDQGPYRVFASLAPLGTEISGLTAIAGILLSKYLEEGGNPNRLLKHLQDIKGDRPFGFGESRINSIPHALAVALRNHLEKHGGLENAKDDKELVDSASLPEPAAAGPSAFELWDLTKAGNQCPDCQSSNISYSPGCGGPVCHDCGHSECS